MKYKIIEANYELIKKKDTFDSYPRTGCSEDDTDGVLMVSTHAMQ